LAELLLRSADLLVSMEERRELGVVVAVGFLRDECVGLQNGSESVAGIAFCSVTDLGEVSEVPGDLTLVPGEQNGFDI
jgi:hypothetical protein